MVDPHDAARPQTASSDRWRLLFAAIPFLLALPVLLRNANHYLPYMCDDSMIVARYAERLIEGHGLTWTDGERVEGYSNFLWVISIAALGSLGLDVLDAARLLGVTCMATVFLSLTRAYRPRSLAQAVPPTIAAVMFASAGPVGVWSIGGLEQPMVAALLAWALAAVFPILDRTDASNRRAVLVGIPLALLCWTRPDAPLFTAVFAGVTVALFELRRAGWMLALRMTVLPVLAVAMQLCFRLIYYGDWLPNPAYIKTRVRWSEGVDYVVDAFEWMVPALILVALALVASFVGKHQRGRAILLACCIFAWAGYLATIGGDIFAGRRHFVPLWVLLSFIVAVGLDWLVRRGRVWITIAVAITSLAAVARLDHTQRLDPKARQAARQIWQWEGEVIARVLGEGFREAQPLLAVTAAGTLPYFSKLPCLDMLGLNDRHIARARPEQPGNLAHDHADGTYVLDRAPDLIVFSLGIHVGFDVGRDMLRDGRFQTDYLLVTFRGYAPHERSGLVYVRRDGKVGIEVEPDVVTVPGYMLEGNKRLFAQPGVDGGIEAVIPANARLTTPPLPLGPGNWRVIVDPPNPDVDVGLYVDRGRPTQSLSLADDQAQVRLRVTSRDTSSLLGKIRIERVAKAPPESRPSTSRQPTFTAQPIGKFEHGLGTWHKQGRAFNKSPMSGPAKRQGPITGNDGKFVNSFGVKTGDRVRGQLTSEPFSVAHGMVLSFRVGGGKHPRVGVRLMEGDRTLLSWHGKDSESLELVRFALTPYAGRTLHIEVYDDSSQAWGHVLADEFLLLHPG